jgi:hypothetical protein
VALVRTWGETRFAFQAALSTASIVQLKHIEMNHRALCSARAFALPLLAAFGAVAFACSATPPETHASSNGALGASAPFLGTAKSYAVLGGSTVTNTNATTLTGDLGVSPGLAITGFPPGIVMGGTTHAGDAASLQAQTDVTAAYGTLAGEACGVDLTGKDLGGLTLTPGVYCFSSSAQLTGDLVLDAGGKADAVFVFKTVSTLTTASNASVHVINGGGECGVFWQIGSSATLGTGTTFAGSILALTSITLDSGAKVSGRVLARNGAVTLDQNTVSIGSCATGPASDAGAPDAVALDAAVTDAASAPDSSAAPDAAVPDAADASLPDSDAGLFDAGSSTDVDAATP